MSWRAATRASALPFALSAIRRNSTKVSETIGTMTMRTKKRVRRLRKLMGKGPAADWNRG